jgi:hypothetical protein
MAVSYAPAHPQRQSKPKSSRYPIREDVMSTSLAREGRESTPGRGWFHGFADAGRSSRNVFARSSGSIGFTR